MKPVIGVIVSMEVGEDFFKVSRDHVESIIGAGGLPILLPYTTSDQLINHYTEMIDGLYLIGGIDIDPGVYGEEPIPELGPVLPIRDAFELRVTKGILDMKKPILGVCRGVQLLNIAIGGKMYQDIHAQIDQELLQHVQRSPKEHGSHFVKVVQDSLLAKLTKKKELKVNSFHHQANKIVPSGYLVSGVASDGVIEAIESKEDLFVLGVQWHPEIMAANEDEASLRIYSGFIKACKGENK